MLRQLVRPRLKLGVAQPLVRKRNRYRIRPRRRLRRKQLRQRRRQNLPTRRVPVLQQQTPLCPRQQLQPTNRYIRRRDRCLQQTNQPSRQRFNAPPIEQVAGVFNHPANPSRLPVPTPLFRNAHRQVELRARAQNLFNARAQTRQLQPNRRVVLQRKHHLEQRMVRQRARRVEHFNQTLKRHILVAVGRKIARPHPTKQLPKARIARRVRAQHQRVDEKPNKLVQRAVRATRDRAADRNVGPSSKPRQQRRKPSLQHHEQARPLPTRNPHIAQAAAKAPPPAPHTAPHSFPKHLAPKAQATSRPPRCDAAQAKARARAPQAQTHAHATEPHDQEQTALAPHPPTQPQAPLRSPRRPKPQPPPYPQPK